MKLNKLSLFTFLIIHYLEKLYVLYYMILYCTILHCTVLYCTVLYCVSVIETGLLVDSAAHELTAAEASFAPLFLPRIPLWFWGYRYVLPRPAQILLLIDTNNCLHLWGDMKCFDMWNEVQHFTH